MNKFIIWAKQIFCTHQKNGESLYELIKIEEVSERACVNIYICTKCGNRLLDERYF